MRWRDISRFLIAFWLMTAVQYLIAHIIGRTLDEFDHLHALILSCVAVVLMALREGSSDATGN